MWTFFWTYGGWILTGVVLCGVAIWNLRLQYAEELAKEQGLLCSRCRGLLPKYARHPWDLSPTGEFYCSESCKWRDQNDRAEKSRC